MTKVFRLTIIIAIILLLVVVFFQLKDTGIVPSKEYSTFSNGIITEDKIIAVGADTSQSDKKICTNKADSNGQIAVFNKNGELKSEFEYVDYCFTDITASANGGFVVSGSTINNSQQIAMLIAFNELGEPIWMQHYQYENEDVTFKSVTQLSNGYYVALGSSGILIFYDQTGNELGGFVDDSNYLFVDAVDSYFATVKLLADQTTTELTIHENDGSIVWSQTFENTIFYSLLGTANNTFITTGTQNGQLVITEFDTDGNIINQQKLENSTLVYDVYEIEPNYYLILGENNIIYLIYSDTNEMKLVNEYELNNDNNYYSIAANDGMLFLFGNNKNKAIIEGYSYNINSEELKYHGEIVYPK